MQSSHPPTGGQRYGLRVKVLTTVIGIGISYLLLELLYSVLFTAGVIQPPSSYLWLFEESGKTVQFDPVRGYVLTTVPSRYARITFGTTEFVGTLKGNAQGFPDRDDFSAQRTEPRRPRIAVFGDSFTAAQYLKKNWPDQVEDLSMAAGQPFELLNFSVDAGGLANWWSILTRIIGKQNYAIDGIVFAVFFDDLRRGFTIAEHRDSRRYLLAHMPSWDSVDWPKTLDDARSFLRPVDGHIVSKESFEGALQGKLDIDLARPFKFYFTPKVVNQVKRVMRRLSNDSFEQGQLRLIEQISDYARSKSIPVMVVRIPMREELIGHVPPLAEIDQFAKKLDARFLDGSDAFKSLDEKGIRDHWLPYDGHWAQSGSDRFAQFMLPALQDWARSFLLRFPPGPLLSEAGAEAAPAGAPRRIREDRAALPFPPPPTAP